MGFAAAERINGKTRSSNARDVERARSRGAQETEQALEGLDEAARRQPMSPTPQGHQNAEMRWPAACEARRMTRRFHAMTILLLGCSEGPSRRQLEPEAVDGPVPSIAPGVVVSPPQPAQPVEVPDAPCVAVTDCRIVARHRLDARFARERGFYRSRAGLVASRHTDWQAHGRPEETFFIEVTESCSVPTGFYIESGRQVWLPSPQSCGPNSCENSTGYYFAPVESAHARHFRPVGHGFFEDGRRVFDRGEPVRDDPPIDRATFHACEGPPEGAQVTRFYPAAEDAHGVFGWGDCGDLIRARR